LHAILVLFHEPIPHEDITLVKLLRGIKQTSLDAHLKLKVELLLPTHGRLGLDEISFAELKNRVEELLGAWLTQFRRVLLDDLSQGNVIIEEPRRSRELLLEGPHL